MKSKKTIILVASILGILLVIGATYAWLTLTVTGTKTNVIKAGSLELTMDDAASTGITLLETVPVLDEVGKTTKGYTFTLKNNGTIASDYTIYLDDMILEANETKISNMNWIRYEWTGAETTTSDLASIQDETNQAARVLETGVIKVGETKNYTLKLWISEEATNEIMGTVYRGKIRIEAVQSAQNPEYVDASRASKPELDDGMIPVIYDEASSSWKKADTSIEWYNYDKQNWANAVTVYEKNRATLLASPSGTEIPMTDINTMWVWIPRYEFTIGNTYGTKLSSGGTPSALTPGAIDIKFVSKGAPLENGTAKYTGDTPSNWYTHPVFCFGTVDQGTRKCSGTETNGIWVGKFETGAPETDPCTTSPSEGYCNKSTLNPVSKPNMSSWRYVTVSTMFTAVKNNMNGTSATATYGFNETRGDSHLMKNSEWGAVAYLTQSKYGKYGNASYTGANKEIYINNYSKSNSNPVITKTGCSSGTPSTPQAAGNCAFTYDKVAPRGNGTGAGGAGASTTGNINGIYDMVGAGYEYVMGNFNGLSGQNTTYHSGFTGPLGEGGSVTGTSFPEAKYYDKYTGTTGYKGDATNADGTEAWYSDTTSFVTSSAPWLLRGGGLGNKTSAGVFYFSNSNGRLYSNYSFRLVRVSLS